MTTTAAALVVGVPAGVVVGRLLWRAFARQLGDPASAWIAIGVLVIGALVVATVAAIVPARRAAASSPGADLRAE